MALWEARIDQTPKALVEAVVSYPSHAEVSQRWLIVFLPALLIGFPGLLPGVSKDVLTPAGRTMGVIAALTMVGSLVIMFPASTNFTGRYLVGAGAVALTFSIAGMSALLAHTPIRSHAPLVVSGAWGALLLGLNVWGLAQLG